jgi:DmsE family decaheme c-type cytochrome
MIHCKSHVELLVALAALIPLSIFAQDAPAVEKPAEAATAQAEAKPAAKAAPGYSKKGADTCLNCHDDEVVLAVFKTKHGQPADDRSPFGHGQLQCEACHGPGGDHTGRVKRGEVRPPVIRFGPDSAAPVSVQNGMCLGCHESAMRESWHIGVHNEQGVACADCHDSHVEKDPVLSVSTQPDVCYTCHKMQRTDFVKPFSHPVWRGQMACSGCHQPHGTTAEAQLVRHTVNDTCYDCHAEKRGPLLFEHEPVAENCDICHSPHGSNHPGLLKTRAPLLCQQCHSQQGHPSVPYGPDGLADGSPSPYLLVGACLNCHTQVHGSNHPSGSSLMR